MTNFKYQATFAAELVAKWENGQHSEVIRVIRNLKNKAQSSYIAARVAVILSNQNSDKAWDFVDCLHPNNR